MPKLDQEAVWKKLKELYAAKGDKINILQLFKEDPKRFEKYR